jgi:hypothetical protein
MHAVIDRRREDPDRRPPTLHERFEHIDVSIGNGNCKTH